MSVKRSFKNRLLNESSLYLRQHGHNPVNWYPWGNEAFDLAAETNRLLLISIGYSSCHWCHVMEKECFEDEEVAGIMNEHFVCIKVDREERPDIDNTYMTAVQLINNGSGGWPLNCIALPDGKPVWGATYFPRDKWMKILKGIAQYHNTNPDALKNYAEELSGGVVTASMPVSGVDSAKVRYTVTDLKAGVRRWTQSFDAVNGGTTGAPKFPMPVTLSFLLHYGYMFRNDSVLNHVRLSLKMIAAGGICDQIGGGFSRYSVDERWHVPHFEKMLYDNAQLLALFSDAWLVFGDETLRDVVYTAFGFLSREMLSPQGLFYSSIDADSEGEEGRYYVWTNEELDDAGIMHRSLFDSYYNIDNDNMWENRYHVLRTTGDDQAFCRKYDIDCNRLTELRSLWREILMKERKKKIRPMTDEKLITSWNAMMASGLVRAYRAFGDETFLSMAVKIIDTLLQESKQNDSLNLRRVIGERDGDSNPAFLDDYAFTIEALLSLYEVTMEDRFLTMATEMTAYTTSHFYDEDNTLFLYCRKGSDVIVTNYFEQYDNVIPSSNTVMAANLFRLGQLTGNDSGDSIAGKMIKRMSPQAVRHPHGFAGWCSMLLNTDLPYGQVVITGAGAKDCLKEVLNRYIPSVSVAASSSPKDTALFANRYEEGKTLLYLCADSSCELPVESSEELFELIEKRLKP